MLSPKFRWWIDQRASQGRFRQEPHTFSKPGPAYGHFLQQVSANRQLPSLWAIRFKSAKCIDRDFEIARPPIKSIVAPARSRAVQLPDCSYYFECGRPKTFLIIHAVAFSFRAIELARFSDRWRGASQKYVTSNARPSSLSEKSRRPSRGGGRCPARGYSA
jgi:hypothetical protein